MIDTNIFYRGKFHCKVNNMYEIGLRERVSSTTFKIDETIVLSEEEFREFSTNLLNDWDFLDGKGGTKCDLDFGDKTEVWKFNNEEIELYKNNCYSSALLITDNIRGLIVDPQGYSYARYCCLEFYEVQENDPFLLSQEKVNK